MSDEGERVTLTPKGVMAAEWVRGGGSVTDLVELEAEVEQEGQR